MVALRWIMQLSAHEQSESYHLLDHEMGPRTYWVYIMTNRSGSLYVGVTNDLNRRVHEHRQRLIPGFAAAYRIDELIYAEPFSEVRDAIAREKQIKGWRRSHKVALIEQANPEWNDLGELWFGK
ncbi:MAG: GIY-YIG nuclease family protein [Thermomicrobiales bacterium]